MKSWTQIPGFLSVARGYYLVRDGLRKMQKRTSKVKTIREDFYQKIWGEAADELGANCELYCPQVLKITHENRSALLRANYTPLDDPVTLHVVGDKSVVHQKLNEVSLPTPDHLVFRLSEIGTAENFLEQKKCECVIKPAAGTGAGQGISTGIKTISSLRWAVAQAARFHPRLLIEEQVPGDNFRLLYLDGELIDAIKRCPPSVVGNGQASIRTLVDHENCRRLESWQNGQSLLRIDADMLQTLRRQNMSLNHVPGEHDEVILKTVINDNAARENIPVLDQVCDSVRDAGSLAVRTLGVRLGGVDVITTDIGRPFSESNGTILEVNTTPGLYHHKRGDRCPVAKTILQSLLNIPAENGAVSGSAGVV